MADSNEINKFKERTFLKYRKSLKIRITEKINFHSNGSRPESLFKNFLQKGRDIHLEVTDKLILFKMKKMTNRKFIIRFKKESKGFAMKAEYTLVFEDLNKKINDFDLKLIEKSYNPRESDNIFISQIPLTQ